METLIYQKLTLEDIEEALLKIRERESHGANYILGSSKFLEDFEEACTKEVQKNSGRYAEDIPCKKAKSTRRFLKN